MATICDGHTASPDTADLPRFEVADIFRVFGDTYAQTHAVSPFEQRLIDDLMACRTARLGGHGEHCPQCGFERYAYNSCRNRHCPKCQTLSRMKWVEARRAELLPAPYFHTVLTLPHELNPLVLANKRLLLGLLFRSASDTLLQFGQQHLGGQLGATMVLHTWDQRLNAHFHLHALVPGGALAPDGESWRPTSPKFLFPVKALSVVFRAKFLETLGQLHHSQALRFTEATESVRTPKDFSTFVDRLYGKAWVVYAKRPFSGPEQTLRYLGRYTHRVAIDNHRLVGVQDGHIRFTYRNRQRGDRLETMALEAHTFIERFLLHILPSGFVRIRHYGFVANRCKAQALSRCRRVLGQEVEPPKPEPKTVVQWMQLWTGVDITRCPQCGHQPLLKIPIPLDAAANSNRAPPARSR